MIGASHLNARSNALLGQQAEQRRAQAAVQRADGAPAWSAAGGDRAPSGGPAHPGLTHAPSGSRCEMCPRDFYAFCVFPRPLFETDTVGLRVWRWGQGHPGQEQKS